MKTLQEAADAIALQSKVIQKHLEEQQQSAGAVVALETGIGWLYKAGSFDPKKKVEKPTVDEQKVKDLYHHNLGKDKIVADLQQQLEALQQQVWNLPLALPNCYKQEEYALRQVYDSLVVASITLAMEESLLPKA